MQISARADYAVRAMIALAADGKTVKAESLADELAAAVRSELQEVGDGRLAVLLPPDLLAEIGDQVAAEVEQAVVARTPDDLESPAALLTVEQAKGLEFDSVVVVEPQEIVDDSERGLNDLYVGLTRATQRLGIVHTGDLPEALSDLE